ncbi:hypothetical protein GQX74_007783 [Glossina fuscipes]|nr:hypothetical protein GQX74_007783 [Glossina fuscipes]
MFWRQRNKENKGSQFMDTSAAPPLPLPSTANGPPNTLWSVTETKHEIDADIMPPPITTQMPMGVRRPSLNNSVATTAPQSNLISDQQLVHLNAVTADVLKTELLDENSQNSLADALHSPEGAVVTCGVSVGGPQSPTALRYHARYGRKTSIDAMIYETNSMQSFPVTNPPTTATPMEVAAVAAAVEMAEIAKAVSVAKVDKFITDLTKSTNVEDTPPNVTEPSLFDVVPNTAAAVIDHALTDILQQAAVTSAPANTAATVVLERNLSNSSGSSPSTSGSPLTGSSPTNSLTTHNSPITQDIILNSEPAVALSAALPIQQLLPAGPTGTTISVNNEVGAATASGLTTDIIMNPSVSPSTILCSDNGAATAVVPNIMTPHQVTMANSILNDIAMQPQPTQQDAAVAALAISNIIMTSPSEVNGNSVTPTAANLQPEVSSATSTAVSNMIIKAAADFISNQEQQQQQSQQQQQQAQAPSATQMLTGQSVTADALNPLNLLLNHSNVGSATQAAVSANNPVAEVAPPFPLAMATPPQESLIVALATENAIQNSVTAAAITTNGAVVTQETSAQAANLHPAAAAAVGAVAVAAAAAIPPAIPQEITTMSDQDLISYINPSTFDQEQFAYIWFKYNSIDVMIPSN